DTFNYRVRRIDTSGIISTIAGTGSFSRPTISMDTSLGRNPIMTRCRSDAAETRSRPVFGQTQDRSRPAPVEGRRIGYAEPGARGNGSYSEHLAGRVPGRR